MEGGNVRRVCHAAMQTVKLHVRQVSALAACRRQLQSGPRQAADRQGKQIHIHTHIFDVNVCVCVRWGHNMRDNLMSTPWRSQLLCPRRNVLIKIKRNFFDFDFIKCDLNELGHIFPQHTLTHTHICVLYVCLYAMQTN